MMDIKISTNVGGGDAPGQVEFIYFNILINYLINVIIKTYINPSISTVNGSCKFTVLIEVKNKGD